MENSKNLSLDAQYRLALTNEDQMRTKMYQPGMESHPMNTDPHYNLINLLESWETFWVDENPQGLLFARPSLTPQSDEQVYDSLKELKPLLQIPNVMVAGGRIFSALFGTTSRDIDIFIWGCTPEAAEQKIQEVAQVLGAKRSPATDQEKSIKTTVKMTRTKNAISFRIESSAEIRDKKRILETKDYQVILRLYRTPSEILHGFDVDSCCLGWDGEYLWATQRAHFALSQGYNTVNFDRLSPSYEHRLIKYATRGMSILVPGIDLMRIDYEALEKCFRERSLEKTSLKGLSTLLYTDFAWTQYECHPDVIPFLLRMIKEKSDYSNPFYGRGHSVGGVIDYLLESADQFKKKSKEYLSEFARAIDVPYDNFEIPYVPTVKKIGFIGATFPIQEFTLEKVRLLLRIDPGLYRGLAVIAEWDFPAVLTFKTIQPGQQMTNTFHQMTLDDPQTWYNGPFYH